MATINGIQYIRADANDNSEIVVRVKQYDKATRFLNITYAESGNVYRIDNSLYRAVAKVKTPTITNRNGDSSISPNLLNKIGIGAVNTLASDKTATASLTGNFGSQKLNLGIPVGKTPQFTIGTVESGLTPSATITGTYENPILNLVLQKGFGNEDYLTVNDFEAMFTPTAMSTQNSENDDAENTAENTINGDKNLESV